MRHLLVFALLLSGCGNILRPFANTQTDAARLVDAQVAMDKRDYSGALDSLLGTSAAVQAQRDVIVKIASAYAGRCGLDFLNAVNTLSTPTTANLFVQIMQMFKGAGLSQVNDCASAETWVRKLAPTNVFTGLSNDEAFFFTMVTMAHIGSELALYADTNQDGTPDPGFDSCNVAQLPDQQARAIGVSLNLAMAAGSVTTVPGGISGLSAQCSSFVAPFDICGKYDPTAFTTNQMKLLDGLIKMSDAPGLGTCHGSIMTCVCP